MSVEGYFPVVVISYNLRPCALCKQHPVSHERAPTIVLREQTRSTARFCGLHTAFPTKRPCTAVAGQNHTLETIKSTTDMLSVHGRFGRVGFGAVCLSHPGKRQKLLCDEGLPSSPLESLVRFAPA